MLELSEYRVAFESDGNGPSTTRIEVSQAATGAQQAPRGHATNYRECVVSNWSGHT